MTSNSNKYEGQIMGREFLPEDNIGGVNISGTWMNKRTGQKINVRQSIQDGDNMIIITDKGQISMEDFSRDYIQASDEIYDENGSIIDRNPIEFNHDLQDIMNYESTSSITHQDSNIIINKVEQKTNTNDQIIKKVFDKLTSFPQVDVNIKWDDFPEAQINTLVNFLDIKIEDITKYIINNYINSQALSDSINKILNDKLSKD